MSTTARLIRGRDVRILQRVSRLRKHDTRTVVIRCAAEPASEQDPGVTTIASCRGCLITLYPCAFEDPIVMSDVKPKPKEHRLDSSPASSIDVITSTLAGHIYHELTYDKWAGSCKSPSAIPKQ